MELTEFMTEMGAILSEVQTGSLRYAEAMDKVRALAQAFQRQAQVAAVLDSEIAKKALDAPEDKP
jgi:hypothetical protein